MDWLLVDSDIFHTSRVLDICQGDDFYHIVDTCIDGRAACDLLAKNMTQGLMMDLLLPQVDGSEVIRYALEAGVGCIGIFTAFYHPRAIAQAKQLGAQFVVPKPIGKDEIEALLQRERESFAKLFADQCRNNCGRWLDVLGMSRHLQGHRALCRAVGYCALHPEQTAMPHRAVYPAVARGMGCTALAVERNIRTAVESLWLRGDISQLDACFGQEVEPHRGKPTNRQMLAALCRMSLHPPCPDTWMRLGAYV